MWLNIGVALLVLIVFFLGTFVLIRSATRINSTFAAFCYTVAVWIVANYIGANFKDHPAAKYFVHADFLFGAVVVLSFWYFTATLLRETTAPNWVRSMRNYLRLPFTLVAMLAMVVSVFPWGVKVYAPAHRSLIIDYNSGFTLYAGILGLLLVAGIASLLLTLRYAHDKLRQQVVTISRGLVAAVVLVAAANLVLPQITKSAAINLAAGNASYVGILAFIIASTYAIVRHQLFDLRFFVVRATAYAVSVGLVTVFYLLPVVWIITKIAHVHTSFLGLLGLVVLSFGLIVLYRYVRTVFDRFTSKVFFRDLYDTQDVLDKLSDLLVRTIDVEKLKTGSRSIILDAIRSNGFTYWLNMDGDHAMLALLTSVFRNNRDGNVQFVDEMTDQQKHAQALRERDVAAIVRLRTTHGELGYITLGYKTSGQPYTAQDRRLLSIAADEIAISMQNALHFDEIQNFNLTLQAQVAEATRKLRRTNEKLKSLDDTKDDFISMASHQLRTPLTSVKGYLSMVLEGDAGKVTPMQQKMLSQAFTSSQRMVYLIADLLNVSRLKTGKFVIEASPTDLSEMITDEIDQLQETAASRSVALEYDKPAQFPALMLDETKIRQVVMNFIDNAIYYTPPGGHIRIELYDKPTVVELRVVDDGIGVPKSEQHHLFTKFYRAGNARKARPDGTGLGLFMAKKVVTAQGGALIFESTEGKGSTFGFTFSKSKLAPLEASESTLVG